MNALLLAASLLALAPGLQAAEVLGLFQSVGRSQWVLAETYLRALERRGHRVTAVTTFPSSQGGTAGNWTEILIPNPFETGEEIDFFEMGTSNKFVEMIEATTYGQAFCDLFLKDENVQRLYRSGKKFDVVVLEVVMSECLVGYAHMFRAPVVAICTFMGLDWMAHMVGNPMPYAYVPSPILGYSTPMNFLERVDNTVYSLTFNLIRNLYYMPKVDALFRTHMNDSTLPSLWEVERRTSLLLVNYHFSHGCPRPLVPAMKEVGGLHVREPKKLPQDLQKFLDEATDGVIYFSMGSNVKSKHWPAEKRQAFVDVFSRLQQRVLWKWEAESLPGQPPNVRTGKWLPQSDILAHKNVRAFISHGGLLSTQEAMARGVPVVALPVFAEQELNAMQAVQLGFAVLLQLRNITAESVQWALDQVLNEPRYRENAQRLSRIFNDRPMKPLDEAVYWTEYVIRHQGAPHLRSAALDLTWYQYFLLDVVAVLVAAAAVLLLAAGIAIRAVLRLFAGKTAAPPQTAKKSKKTHKKD
ncbi:UDP-glycosyltransferase UGT5-like [Schistocerca serialis cubense]|uniref:UDP-glycosyltransferase UGT5-like n=1 Tax=Schistocerca serialis cubense TaxID=2023355 RepID=UPI00214EDB70|nr:UDP-glycosyltransferase UGT5-like [Schistocerca serialis cubense]XP_049943047.1 UDP-glycosyltransferase UGT5-like [Schistocerca serialis cubense]XP_049943048.1 UDP-glycosyltransferase UGT5-like [Schistocerca serialis cubense]